MDAVNFTKEIPSWLDQDLYEKAIQSYESDPEAKVLSFDLVPALQPGQNMASAVFRAKVKFTSKHSEDEKEISMIVKTQPVSVDLPFMAHLKDPTLFETEIGVYTNVLGRVQELITSAGYEDVMGPKLIYQTMTPKPVIILEDVSVNGFDTEILAIHDDFELSKRIVKYLAKFHAATFFLQDEQKIDASNFNSTTFQLSDMAKMLSQQSYEYFSQVMPEWSGFLSERKEGYLEKISKTYSPNTGPRAWNVLNHGDFLFKNLMYKKIQEGDGVEDFMMLDFQICIYGSPPIDLIYTLYNFVSDENRLARYDEILFTYHEQFVEALKKFGYLKSPPTMSDLQIEMLKNGHFQANCVIFMYPFLIFDMTQLTMEDMADGMKGLRVKIYNNDKYQKVAKKELEFCLMKGFLGN